MKTHIVSFSQNFILLCVAVTRETTSSDNFVELVRTIYSPVMIQNSAYAFLKLTIT
jgi:hypothetical protein